jgi:hypothetical protein
MLAIGNEELKNYPLIGKSVKCPHCGKKHKVEDAEQLSFYKCGDKAYLAGVNGKNIMERFK